MSKAWMPIYWGDFKANTSHLTTLEKGAYLMLIAHYWEMGCLPTENARLRRITGLNERQWKRSKAVIAAFFDEQWKHLRIEAELEQAKLRSISQSRKAQKRWNNNGHTHAAALPRQCQSQSQSYKEKNGLGRKEASKEEIERLEAKYKAQRQREGWA